MPVDASTLSREHAVRLSAGAIGSFESYAKRRSFGKPGRRGTGRSDRILMLR
jgi:hypothetical protein